MKTLKAKFEAEGNEVKGETFTLGTFAMPDMEGEGIVAPVRTIEGRKGGARAGRRAKGGRGGVVGGVSGRVAGLGFRAKKSRKDGREHREIRRGVADENGGIFDGAVERFRA